MEPLDPTLFDAASAGYIAVVRRLLERGADVNGKNEAGETALHLAAQNDRCNVIELLLERGADVNAKNKLDETALHSATRYDKLSSVQLLLHNGADINARNSFGQTAIHQAAKSGYNKVIELLLNQGADDSITANDGNLAKTLSTHESIEKLFNNPPVVDWKKIKDEKIEKRTKYQVPPLKPTDQCTEICHKQYARVTFYSGAIVQSREMTLYDLVYNDKLTNAGDKNRWIHLPLNNIKWIKDLIERLCFMDDKDESQCRAIKAFVDRNFQKRSVGNHDACFRQPHFHWEGSAEGNPSDGMEQNYSNGKDNFPMISLVIPYFDIETSQSLKLSYEKKVQLQDLYSDLFWPQSLDRSYHLGLSSTDQRDHDQVLAKGLAARKENIDRLLMVPQLWLWKIDQRTIISTCPDRFHGGDGSANETLIKSIKRRLDAVQKELVEDISPEHFAGLVVQQCLNFFDDPCKAGLDNPASWTFATYIADQSDKEVKLRQTFLESLKARQSGAKAQTDRHHKLDIREEVECLREVKDIRDEVNMIENVLDSQIEVFKTIQSSVKQRKLYAEPAWSRFSYDQTIYVLRQRWQRLDEDAERVEKSLNHLLDLKQKQASLDVSVSASEEAKTAAIQNQAVLVFTIVTVIFTPLSFVTSLYALDYFKPIQGTPAHSSGWNQNNIAKALGLAEGLTLIIVILLVGFALCTHQFRTKKPKKSEWKNVV